MAEVPDPEGPQDPEFEHVTLTVDDFLPLLNAARNSYLAAKAVGMPEPEAQAIQMMTYQTALTLAIQGSIGS